MPPLFGVFFFTKATFAREKLVLNEYEIFSQIAEKGHFRDSNLHKFLGEHGPKTPLQGSRLR